MADKNQGSAPLTAGEIAAPHKSRRSANIAARNKLAEKYPEEFRKLLRVELETRGFQMEPTPEEKAEKRLRELIAEYPQLGEKYRLLVVDESQDPGEALDELREKHRVESGKDSH